MECIILAGGLGTRLRNTIGDYPKCMAEVNGKPFLHYIFTYLQAQGCTRTLLSLGYKHEIILKWLETEAPGFETDYVIEEEPLGTGGGIQLAMHKAVTTDVAVVNGDTLFQADLDTLMAFHKEVNAETTLALKEMYDFDRYGVVQTDEQGRILSFEEKQKREQGAINGGIYVINKGRFLERNLPVKFSFEKDYLEAFVAENRFYGCRSEGYFIDIGIAEDYHRSAIDFKQLFPGKA